MKNANYFSVYVSEEELLERFNAISEFYRVKGVAEKAKSRIITELLRKWILLEEKNIKNEYGISVKTIVDEYRKIDNSFKNKFGE